MELVACISVLAIGLFVNSRARTEVLTIYQGDRPFHVGEYKYFGFPAKYMTWRESQPVLANWRPLGVLIDLAVWLIIVIFALAILRSWRCASRSE